MYWVCIKEGIIIMKGETREKVPLDAGKLEVSKEIYDQIGEYQAEAIMDEEGNVVSAVPIPKPPQPPQETEPTIEEILLVALTEIQTLKTKVAELEGN